MSRQEFSTMRVDDRKKLALLEAIIPVMEDLTELMGNWNGDESGIEEDIAQTAEEAFNSATKLMDTLQELEEYTQ